MAVYGIGGCVLCEGRATVYYEAGGVHLCNFCDQVVHSANAVACHHTQRDVTALVGQDIQAGHSQPPGEVQ